MYYTFFFFIDPATTEIYTLPLHDALPISPPETCGPALARGPDRREARPADAAHAGPRSGDAGPRDRPARRLARLRSEEHTSELQSPDHLVCRLLLEKKKYDVDMCYCRVSC